MYTYKLFSLLQLLKLKKDRESSFYSPNIYNMNVLQTQHVLEISKTQMANWRPLPPLS